MNIGSLVATLGVDASGLLGATAAMNSFEKSTTTSLNRMSQRLRTFGYLASAVLTLPIVAAGKASMKAASEFEYSMQKIVGLVGISQKQVNEWSKDIQNMAIETSRAPQELADALYFITSAGYKSSESLNILKISAQGAAAGLGQTQDVANLLTSAMNAYRAKGLTAARAADVFVAAVREGKIEASGFASALQQVLPIASALNVPIDQVAGSMAAMSLQGASAANSAVYLKGIFNSIMKIKPSNEAGKALAELGSSGEKLRQMLGEQGLMPVLLKIQEWSRSNPLLLNKVFGNIRALTGDLSLTGDNLAYNEKVMRAVTGASGDLARASAATADTIKVQLGKALATVKNSAIKFGLALAKQLLPIINDLVKWLKNVTDWFNGLNESTQKTIVSVLMLVAALGPLTLLFSVIGYGISGLITVGTKLVQVFSALKLVMMSNPYVLAATAIIAAGAAIFLFRKKSEDAVKAQNSFNTALVKVNGSIKELKSLTSIDFAAMSAQELISTMNEANKQYQIARKNALDTQARVAAGTQRKGGSTSYISWQMDIAIAAKEKYNQAAAALQAWGDSFGKVNTAIQPLVDTVDDLNTEIETLKKLTSSEFPGMASQWKKGADYNTNKGAMSNFNPDNELSNILKEWMDPKGKSTQLAAMNTAKQVEAVLQQQNEAMSQTKVLASELNQIFTNMFMSIGEGWNSVVDSIINGLKRLVAAIMARIVVFGILSLISGGGGALAGGAGKLISGGLGDFMFKGLGRGMANGGIVPGGYPNDSFPAMLSSNEAVIPLDKWGLGSQQNIRLSVDTIRVSGKDIAIVLRRSGAYN